MNTCRVVVIVSRHAVASYFRLAQDAPGELQELQRRELPAPFTADVNAPQPQRLHDRQMLLTAIEEHLRRFCNEVLLSTHGTVESNRQLMPLLVALEGDLPQGFDALVPMWLADAGYATAKVVDYERLLVQLLADTTPLPFLLLAKADHGDLYLALYHRQGAELAGRTLLEGKAQDPRLEAVARYVWERADAKDQWVPEQVGMPIVREFVRQFAASGQPERTATLFFPPDVNSLLFVSQTLLDKMPIPERQRPYRLVEQWLIGLGHSNFRMFHLVMRGDLTPTHFAARQLQNLSPSHLFLTSTHTSTLQARLVTFPLPRRVFPTPEPLPQQPKPKPQPKVTAKPQPVRVGPSRSEPVRVSPRKSEPQPEKSPELPIRDIRVLLAQALAAVRRRELPQALSFMRQANAKIGSCELPQSLAVLRTRALDAVAQLTSELKPTPKTHTTKKSKPNSK